MILDFFFHRAWSPPSCEAGYARGAGLTKLPCDRDGENVLSRLRTAICASVYAFLPSSLEGFAGTSRRDKPLREAVRHGMGNQG